MITTTTTTRRLIAAFVLLAPLSAEAAISKWNSTTNGNWNVTGNWTPAGVPGPLDSVEIGSVAGTEGTVTTLDTAANVASLTMTNGNDLNTGSSLIVVNGETSISGSGTKIILGQVPGLGDHRSLDTDFMNISSNGTLKMQGGMLQVADGAGYGRLDLASGGTIYGYGVIHLNAAGPGAKLTMASGNLTAGSGGSTFGDTPGTLRIDAADPGATLDMDQGSSTITVLPSGTLDINVPLADAYGTTIELRRNSTLDIEDSWSFDGTLHVSTGGTGLPGQFAGPATITGAQWTMEGGAIHLDNADDHLIFDSAATVNDGEIHHDAGTLQFDKAVTFGSGADWTVGPATRMVVNDTVVIANQDWNWDGDGGDDNIIEINENGTLRADLGGVSSDDGWSGSMRINGGSLGITGSGNTWSIDGNLTVGGTAPSTISGSAMVLEGRLAVDSGASLDMLAANVWNSGDLVVDGVASLEGGTTWAGTTVSGSGWLSQNSDATVTEDTTISVDTYDMDGDRGGDARFQVSAGKTFAIDSARIESSGGAFDGRIDINGGTLAVQADWRMGSTASITLSGSGGYGGTLAEGGTLTMGSGSTLVARDEGNVIDTDVVFEEGSLLSVENEGSVDLGDMATGVETITLAGGDITEEVPGCTVRNKSVLTVTGDSKIQVTTFGWDSGNTTIEAGGSLSIEVSDIDEVSTANRYDYAELGLRGGSLDVDLASDLWIMDAATYLFGGSTISGDTMQIGADDGGSKGELTVYHSGTATITAPLVFASDAEVAIDSGTTLVTHNTTFESVNGGDNASFSGEGTWIMSGHNDINEPTTIHMEGGALDLDNSAGGSAMPRNTEINADLTIHARSLEDYGSILFTPSGSSYCRMNIAEGQKFDVRLDDPADFWTINSLGIVNYNGGTPVSTFLDGADVHMAGTLNISGQGRTASRMAISGTVNIMDSAGWFVLGGDGANVIDGGTINGPGLLKADDDKVLSGSGTINADIRLPGGMLYANNGMLTVAGAIHDAYEVGTADTDGILNVVNDWNTATSTTYISLRGGELRGGAVTLDGYRGIDGYGLVSARVVNNYRISVLNEGETLVLQPPLNDNVWDGTTKHGRLEAHNNHATLELRDTTTYPFSGGIAATHGATVFLNGFSMSMQAQSSLELRGGTLQYSGGSVMQIMGALTVNDGLGDSRLKTSPGTGGFALKTGATVSLNGTLELDTQTVEIESGATFSGSGTLRNNTGCTLTLHDNATLTGTLENNGALVVGSSPGHVLGENFTQLADGTLHIEIGGPDIADRDTLHFSGHTKLAGSLDLSLLNGFAPSLGESYTILETATIEGTFTTVIQPPTMPGGLEFEVGYAPSEVILTVVSSGDAYGEWIDTFASLVDPADKLKTADPDGDGMDNLAEFALDGDPTSAARSGKIVGKIATVDGSGALTLTFPVRTGATHAPGDPAGGKLVLNQASESLAYSIQGSADLETFPLDIAEVTGADAAAIQAGLPVLGSSWEYRSFRCPGPVPGDTNEFMRVRISE